MIFKILFFNTSSFFPESICHQLLEHLHGQLRVFPLHPVPLVRVLDGLLVGDQRLDGGKLQLDGLAQVGPDHEFYAVLGIYHGKHLENGEKLLEIILVIIK